MTEALPEVFVNKMKNEQGDEVEMVFGLCKKWDSQNFNKVFCYEVNMKHYVGGDMRLMSKGPIKWLKNMTKDDLVEKDFPGIAGFNAFRCLATPKQGFAVHGGFIEFTRQETELDV